MSEFSIATLGSSLTAGNAPGVSRSWHMDLIEALTPGKRTNVTTYNFGVGGGDINTGLALVSEPIKLRPNCLLIEYSMNDCQLVYSDVLTKTISLINTIKSGAPSTLIYLLTMNTVVGDSLSATSRSALPTFYQMYRDLSVSQSVGLIDSAPDWSGVTLSEIPDGIHPLAESNKSRLIPSIVEALSPLIN